MPHLLDYAAAVMYERCRRLPEGNRARAAAERAEPDERRWRRGRVHKVDGGLRVHGAQIEGWRARARRVLREKGLEGGEREPLPTHARVPPWDPSPNVDFFPHLCRRVTRRDPPEKRRKAAQDTLALRPRADLDGYTDGSVLDPRRLRTGGGGYVLRDAAQKEHRGRCAAGRRCTSYRAELTAMIKILDDVIAGVGGDGVPITFPDGRGELRIALDSQSAITALAKGPSAQGGVLEMQAWDRLIRVGQERAMHVTVQYVPGHVELEEQEKADRVAKEAAR
eukprot:gene19588-biopygen35622